MQRDRILTPALVLVLSSQFECGFSKATTVRYFIVLAIYRTVLSGNLRSTFKKKKKKLFKMNWRSTTAGQY